MTSTGEIFEPVYDTYVKLWNPRNDAGFDPMYIAYIDSYEYVNSCAPEVTPVLDFYTDSASINAGECTTLYWSANNAYQQVFLDSTNGPVVSQDGHAPASGSTSVCPINDSTYWLTGAYGTTQDIREVTVYVVPPTDTPIPPTETPIPPTRTPIPTNTNSPTENIPTANISTANPNSLSKFIITKIKTKPVDIKQYGQTLFLITVINEGTQKPSPWRNFQFSGEILIKSSNGTLIEQQQFQESKNAFLAPSDNINNNERKISVKTKFYKTVQSGSMEVIVYTNVDGQETIKSEPMPITVSGENINDEIIKCTAVVLDKLNIAFPLSDGATVAIAQNRVMAEVVDCQDVSCAAKLIKGYMEDTSIEYILQNSNPIGALIVSIRDLFNGQESLNVCRKPGLWMIAIFDEFTRSGRGINKVAVHSPALITIENEAGQQSGFLDKNTPITEIDGSIAFLYEESQYIYFPTQKVDTQLIGIGNGVMTIDITNIQGDQVFDTSYIDIPVTTKMIAKVDSAETTTTMTVITGNKSQTIQPGYETTELVVKDMEKSNFWTLIKNNPFLVAAGLLLVLFFGFMFRPKKKIGNKQS